MQSHPLSLTPDTSEEKSTPYTLSMSKSQVEAKILELLNHPCFNGLPALSQAEKNKLIRWLPMHPGFFRNFYKYVSNTVPAIMMAEVLIGRLEEVMQYGNQEQSAEFVFKLLTLEQSEGKSIDDILMAFASSHELERYFNLLDVLRTNGIKSVRILSIKRTLYGDNFARSLNFCEIYFSEPDCSMLLAELLLKTNSLGSALAKAAQIHDKEIFSAYCKSYFDFIRKLAHQTNNPLPGVQLAELLRIKINKTYVSSSFKMAAQKEEVILDIFLAEAGLGELKAEWDNLAAELILRVIREVEFTQLTSAVFQYQQIVSNYIIKSLAELERNDSRELLASACNPQTALGKFFSPRGINKLHLTHTPQDQLKDAYKKIELAAQTGIVASTSQQREALRWLTHKTPALATQTQNLHSYGTSDESEKQEVKSRLKKP